MILQRSGIGPESLEGLRVADASGVPSIPSHDTNATVCAIAERAAEIVRETVRAATATPTTLSYSALTGGVAMEESAQSVRMAPGRRRSP
ncbi:GMC oxidoreductase [Streptomyces flaveolus]|uniref:GMC oxidoreductase n=1 Tax=Streptomyces flaveolus TaxID=67297 RepID=UPI000671F655|nr:hypothetical protein ACZ91_14550 [Streptomyces regensis]